MSCECHEIFLRSIGIYGYSIMFILSVLSSSLHFSPLSTEVSASVGFSGTGRLIRTDDFAPAPIFCSASRQLGCAGEVDGAGHVALRFVGTPVGCFLCFCSQSLSLLMYYSCVLTCPCVAILSFSTGWTSARCRETGTWRRWLWLVRHDETYSIRCVTLLYAPT